MIKINISIRKKKPEPISRAFGCFVKGAMINGIFMLHEKIIAQNWEKCHE